MLKLGGPIAPFLFTMVAEDLSGLSSIVVVLDLFYGFRVWLFDLVISHLQYANDTIILVDDAIKILLSTKDIVWCF